MLEQLQGNYGIQRVSKRGEMNFSWLNTLTYPVIATPLGGDVAAYLTNAEANDPSAYYLRPLLLQRFQARPIMLWVT